MRVDIYLNFQGNCEEAFQFYAQALGGTITNVMKHSANMNPSLPAEWGDKVMHANLDLGNIALLGADVPAAQPMRSAYVTLTLDTASDVERIYTTLSTDGEVFMALQKTFFTPAFAMLRDRFGINWMLLAAVPAESK